MNIKKDRKGKDKQVLHMSDTTKLEKAGNTDGIFSISVASASRPLFQESRSESPSLIQRELGSALRS